MFPTNFTKKPEKPCIDWTKSKLGTEKITIQPMSEHAHEQKHLYTITDCITGKIYLLIETLNDTENCLKFISIAKQLTKNNILVPTVFFQRIEKNRCWLITSHFGYQTALSWLTSPHKESQRKQLLEHFLSEISHFQKQKIEYPIGNYGHKKRLEHMNLTDEFFIHKLLSASQSDYDKKSFAYIKQYINDNTEKTPIAPMHFDFHSANIMLLPKRTLGILDFQDMALGPINYDLASILTDHYYYHNEKEVQYCIKKYYHDHLSESQKNKMSELDFIESTTMIAIQRHLKNIGIFTRLFFKNKHHYIKNIPIMMHRLKQLCQKNSTLSHLPEILWSTKMKCLYINAIEKHCTKQKQEHLIDELLQPIHAQKPALIQT